MISSGIHLGDCLELMKEIPDTSVDMILCDLPYGTTQNAWDSIIPLKALWAEYGRIAKETTPIVLTAAQPFTSVLVSSNLAYFKYEWIWEKDNGTGFLNAKKQPLRNHEEVLVFYRKQCVYNPQMREGKPYTVKAGTKSTNYGKQIDVVTTNTGKRYPLTAVRFSRDKSKVHPTQKPEALWEYLIKTYTNPGDLVLDNCAGSGTTGVACINTNRRFICMEKELTYFETMKNRINEAECLLEETNAKS